uniref:Uncharacterized protein n=1 Tax=Sphaerodactylus townsendi TaxID=933632 RepID=A0ACB8FUM1_9SAUR
MRAEPGRGAHRPAPVGGAEAARVPRGSLLRGGRPAESLGGSARRCGVVPCVARGRERSGRPGRCLPLPSQDWRAWRRRCGSGGRSPPERPSARRRPEGLSRPDGLPPPEALGRPIQPLGWRRAWRRGGHRVRGQRRRTPPSGKVRMSASGLSQQ